MMRMRCEEGYPMATEQDVVKVLRYMAAAWPRVELSPETVAVYVMHLLRARVAADVLLLAACHLVDTCEFFPTVAELRAKAVEIASRRAAHMLTANYRLCGEEIPEELRLPPGLSEHVWGPAPAMVLEAGD